MGLFSRKSKAAAAESKPVETTDEDKPKPQPYRHIPKHAAADASRHGSTTDLETERARISAASNIRLQNAQFDSALGNAAYTQSIARSNVHNVPSPTLSLASSHRKSWSQASKAHEIYMTDPDAPPMPSSSSYYAPSAPRSRHPSRPSSVMRVGSDYFGATPMTGTTPDSPTLGPIKASALRAPAFSNPHHSSDSGYESNGPSANHSRAPSEHEENSGKSYLPRVQSGGLLSEMSLTEEILGESIFAEPTVPDEKLTDVISPSILRLVDAAPAEPRSTRRLSSTSKKTRFEEPRSAPRPAAQWNVSASNEYAGHSASESLASTTTTSTAPTPSPASSHNGDDHTTPRPSPFDPHTAPLPQPTPKLTRRTSIPPLSILDGLKVNKKGTILDEEGDTIGELVEGDLLNCVRQKANAFGEVLDEYGNVVGIVRTVVRQPEPVQASTSHRSRGSESALPSGPKYSSHRVSQSFSHIMQPQPEQANRVANWFDNAMNESAAEGAYGEGQRGVALEHTIEYAGRLVQSESPRRGGRPLAERTLSDLSKSYARPSMTSVPEGSVAEEDRLAGTPGIYSYRGDVPNDSSAQQATLLRSKSPAPSIASRKSYNGAPVPVSMAKTIPASSNRRATHYGTGLQPLKSSLSVRSVNQHSPLRRSPLSSHEVSPNGSDEGDFIANTDDVRPPIPPLPGHLNRTRSDSRASVMTTATTASRATNPNRKYFSHGGRISVSDARNLSNIPSLPPSPSLPHIKSPDMTVKAADTMSVRSTKRGRFGLSFRKKSQAA